MNTITTRDGTPITIIREADLLDPIASGERVRAYCHLHGSDHQRSLSIDPLSGWGYCYSCQVCVLVHELSPEIATRLLARSSTARVPHLSQGRERTSGDRVAHPPTSKRIPSWQQEEVHLLRSLED